MATSKICKVDGCGKAVKSLGWCMKHYLKWRDDPASRAKRCSIDGCERAVKSLGYCSAHYQMHRIHGSALAGRTRPGALLAWIRSHVAHQGEECLEWPFGRQSAGYGRVNFKGRGTGAHRVMCEMAHGDAPTDGHEVAHSCNNPPCMNPGHLRWDTRAGNFADKVGHGTSGRGEGAYNARLREKDVIWIRSNFGKITIAEMARTIGVHFMTVSNAVKRRTWKNVA